MSLLSSLLGMVTVLLLAAAPSAADEPQARPLTLLKVTEGVVSRAEKALVIVLEDGTRVRLAGVRAPDAVGHGADAARRAAAMLLGLVEGRRVGLFFDRTRHDRHGRLVAHVVRDGDDLWLQDELVAAGLAVVVPLGDERPLSRTLLETEADARQLRRGLWSAPAAMPRTPDSLGRADTGHFRIVEGVVRDAAEVRGTVYLNFGADWRTDFTIVIPPVGRKIFRDEGVDPLAWEGKRLRVRGWMQHYNGPMIEIDHPDWIEAAAPVGAEGHAAAQ